jgi:hypothetical protein
VPKADSLNARIARQAASIDRAFTALNGQRAPIEGWSGLPTIDQQRALGFVLDDAQKALVELDRLVNIDIPTAYKTMAKKAWSRPVRAVPVPAERRM